MIDTDRQLVQDLRAIELQVTTGYTLADAMRDGCAKTDQEIGKFGDGIHTACALTSAMVAARDRGFLQFDSKNVA